MSKTTESDFYFVVTGFQLLSAIEARCAFGGHRISRLFIPRKLANRCQDLLTGWTSIHVLDDKLYYRGGPSVMRWFPTIRSARRHLRRLEFPERLFLGAEGEVPRAFCALAQPTDVLLLEDGTASLVSIPKLLGSHLPTSQPSSWAVRLAKMVLYGIEPSARLDISAVFTMFEFDLETTADSPAILKNRLEWCQSRLHGSTDDRVLLGSPFVERGMLDANSYIDLIVRAQAADSLSVYVPHPSERKWAGNWDKASNIGLRVEPNSSFFELSALRAGSLPEHVSTFGSTASFTLAAMGYSQRTKIYWDDAIRASPGYSRLLEKQAARHGIQFESL